MTNEDLFNKLYTQLNDAQKKAVDTIEGPVVVNAGPGTGKTQILTLRIANIIRKQGNDTAENILALTFTNAGVRAMRERLAKIIGSDAYRVGIFTFHSFAEHMIKSYPDYFQDLLVSKSITDVGRYAFIESIITQGDYSILKPFVSPTFFVPSVLHAIDELKRDNISPEDFAAWNEQYKEELLGSEDSYYKRNGKGFTKGDLKPDALKKYDKNLELVEAYTSYEHKLKQEQMYDYNDMILNVIKAMEEHQDFVYELQEQYQYFLVDEHQDTNASQNRIVEIMLDTEHLNGRPNIFTVGDDKQAIYRFQGASLENFLSFEKSYTDMSTIQLTDNYRSGQEVLDVSHNLISHDESDRAHQSLKSHRDKAGVEVHQFNSYIDELDWIAQDVKVQAELGMPYEEVAILYRENKHTKDIQRAMARHGIPSVVVARENILDSALIKKIILLMECVSNMSNNHALAQVLYTDIFDTQAYDAVRIVERFRRNKRDKETGTKDLFKVIQEKKILKEIGVDDTETYLSIAQTLQLAHTSFASMSFLNAFDELIASTGIIKGLLHAVDGERQLRFYDRFYQELRSLCDEKPNTTLLDVLNYVQTLREYNLSLDSQPSSSERGVRLLTAHKSKGLEYKHVYITNVVDKVWGNKTTRKQFELPSGTSKGDNDDERRLLYVGITRAQERCVLSCSNSTGERQTSPSQFLYDLDSQITTWSIHEESAELALVHQTVDQGLINTTLFDSELVKTLFLKRALSVTALNNYLDCPAKYFVNNLLQIPATYSRSLIYGSLIHRALELFFRESQKSQSILPKQHLIDTFIMVVEQEYLSDEEKKDILTKGLKSLEGYYDTQHNKWTHESENEVRVNGVNLALHSSTLVLTGVLDKVERDTSGSLRVIDYKTGKTFSEKSKDQKAALERQVVFYSLLLDLYRDGASPMSSGVLDFVEPNKKTGEYEHHELSPTSQDKEALVSHIQSMYDEITSGISFLDKRCGSSDCDACKLLGEKD